MHKPSPWILVLFLMQMTKLKYGTKIYHSRVPLRKGLGLFVNRDDSFGLNFILIVTNTSI